MPKENLWKEGQSGNPKGRPPGSLSYKEIYRQTLEKIVASNHDPVLAMIEIATNMKNEVKVRFLANKELMARVAPPIKAITIDADDSVELVADILEKKLKESFLKWKRDF